MPDIFHNQSIQNFYDVALQKDFARKNLFRVNFIETSFSNITFDERDLVYIETLSLPQRTINNQQVRFMGLDFNVPGTASYPGSNAWNVTFRMPGDLSLRGKLEQWTRNVFDDQTSRGAYNLSDLGIMSLSLMDKEGLPIIQYILEGVYCVSLGDYSLDIKDNGSIVTQPAVLAYQYWTSSAYEGQAR
jgi:hypothetical protein